MKFTQHLLVLIALLGTMDAVSLHQGGYKEDTKEHVSKFAKDIVEIHKAGRDYKTCSDVIR
jgi:hypothetical protein